MKNKLLLLLLFLGIISVCLPPVVKAQQTQIFLFTTDNEVKLNSEFLVNVNIRSDQNTLGTDLVISYDAQALSLVEVIPGVVYQDFSKTDNSMGKSEQNGLIYLSGIADFNRGVIPVGNIAALKFIPLKTGSTEIEVLFDSSDSTLTGVIPFEGNEANLLAQAPQLLFIDVLPDKWWLKIWSLITGLFKKKIR